MYLKKIQLKNFQIHRNLELEFDKRFTVLTGANDSGKSSIIRAIYWTLYNEPNGDWMCRYDKKGNQKIAMVKLWFEDGTVVVREKGKGVNRYEVDGEEYENFGYNVPTPVKEAINIYPFVTNKASFNINIAMQDEAPFLIQESDPIKASVLDVLTGNSVLQKSISSFNKESIAISKQITHLQSSIEESKAMLETIPDLQKADKAITQYGVKVVKLSNLSLEVEHLEGIKGDWEFYTSFENKKVPDLKPIQELFGICQNLSADLIDLIALRKAWRSAKDSIKPIPDVSGLSQKVATIQKLKRQLETLQDLQNSLEDETDNMVQADNTIAILGKELKKIYEDHPNCPTCGKGWTKC